MVKSFEVTSTGIVLRGDWQFPGDLLVGEPSSTLLVEASDDVPGERVIGGIDTGPELEVPAISDAEASDKLDRPSVVSQDAAVEDATVESVAVQSDILVDEDAVDVVHVSPPAVVRTSTVADAGEAASFPGRGR